MSISPFMPSPATGDSFIGRKGLVKNLRDHVARGESVAVIGGPKLGKTSLVRTVMDGLVDRTVIDVDLGRTCLLSSAGLPVRSSSWTIWTTSPTLRLNRCLHGRRRRERPSSW